MHKTSLILVLTAAVSVRAAGWIDHPETFWKDPSFQRAFMGSYGMRAEIEPRVSVVEKELMEKVMKLMSAEGGGVKAAALLEKNLKATTSAVFDFTLANLHFQEDRLTNALTYYQSAVEKFPTFQRAYKNMALIRIRQGEFEAAIEPLTTCIELGVNDGLTYGLLGYAYTMTEQFVSAESAYRLAMMFQPKTLDWKLGLCRALFKQQKYGEAIAACDELLRRDPAKADYLLLQANAYLGMKQPMRAAEIYELLDLTGKTPVAALHSLGDIYVNEGHLEQGANAYLRALLRDDKPDISKQLRNVEVLTSRSAYASAAELLKEVSARTGAEVSSELRKRMLKLEARLAAARGEAGDEQARILEEIVKLDPLDGDALILLGQHHAPRHAEKAIFYYERAEGLEKFEADARLRHAQILVKDGKYQEALPLLKRALELKPREDVQRYAEQVERAARRNG
jgi:tetratricopeptide (TPR) repeat protein